MTLYGILHTSHFKYSGKLWISHWILNWSFRRASTNLGKIEALWNKKPWLCCFTLTFTFKLWNVNPGLCAVLVSLCTLEKVRRLMRTMQKKPKSRIYFYILKCKCQCKETSPFGEFLGGCLEFFLHWVNVCHNNHICMYISTAIWQPLLIL